MANNELTYVFFPYNSFWWDGKKQTPFFLKIFRSFYYAVNLKSLKQWTLNDQSHSESSIHFYPHCILPCIRVNSMCQRHNELLIAWWVEHLIEPNLLVMHLMLKCVNKMRTKCNPLAVLCARERILFDATRLHRIASFMCV